jgi:hypothetical protein
MSESGPSFTAFVGQRRVAAGFLPGVVTVAHAHADDQLLVFEDATGRPVDLDLRGTLDEALARVSAPSQSKPARGRPRLGVTAREVTLLPRHWEWLAAQPGGASAALRRLVEQARRESGSTLTARRTQEATYRVMTALAGDLPNYEEALRALFANDYHRLGELAADWPNDVREYVLQLSAGGS